VDSGRSERADSGSAADVLIHRVTGVIPRRCELLRSTGLQLLHTDQDRDAGLARRGRDGRWVGHRNARHAVNRLASPSINFSLVSSDVPSIAF